MVTGESLTRWLITHVAKACELDEAEVDVDRPLRDYGLTSRQSLALLAGLEDELDEDLPDEVLWQHPTIRALAAALTGEPAPDEPVSDAPAEPVAESDAVAVVGIGCRLPGGINGPAAFWQALLGGEHVITEVPSERWAATAESSAENAAALEHTTRWGGFLPDIAGFDAEFFGISPREAAAMDPQQRMLLEVASEAFDHAGIAPESLRGSSTGVFVGISGNEYSKLTLGEQSKVDAWGATGSALSIAANRLSYVFDLRGPSIAVDTACSSSLVAVHQALVSLRAGECEAAVVGGTNLLLGPEITGAFDELGITSEDGLCKTFDASANGIARAEGAGVVLLKPLSAAERDGDRVLAVLRGSAVNSDGRSNGITAPNPTAQQDLLRSAYAAAGVPVGEVDYVEAHGTGTPLGDPIEVHALGTVLGGTQRENPLLVGSVKSNLGHLEAAAGITGLIKTVLALSHGQLPPSLHFTEPNPRIPFDELGVRVVDEARSWPSNGRPARAGVSAFGFGGTNAHVVVEQASAVESEVDSERPGQFVVSAPSTPRLAEAADALADYLTSETPRLADVEHTLARRAGSGQRAVVTARSRDELLSGLRSVATKTTADDVVTGDTRRWGRGPLWVFSGQGAQWIGMGQQLLQTEPVFAAAIDDVDATLLGEWGHSLRDLLAEARDPNELKGLQPVLFGVHIGLARLWQSCGITPGAVTGHSVGEVAAAVVAGALSLSDGVRVAVRRSRYLVLTGDGGAMASLVMTADEVAARLRDYPDVDISGYNAPGLTAVAGVEDQVRALVAELEGEGRMAKLIPGDVASHSRRVDPYIDELRSAFEGIQAEKPQLKWYPTATQDPRAEVLPDAGYWVDNARQPVRFTQAVAAALDDGFGTVMEISPHPVLLSAVTETAQDRGTDVVTVPTLRRRTDETEQFHRMLATVLANGGTPATAGNVVDLPSAPWRHQRHWAAAPKRTVRAGAHPLLGTRVDVPGEDRVLWRQEPGALDGDWLTGLQHDGRTVLPAACFIEMMLSAGADALDTAPTALELRNLTFDEPLVLAENTAVTTAFEDGVARIYTKSSSWTLHAAAEVVSSDRAPRSVDVAADDQVNVTDLYGRLRELGIDYGAALATVTSASRGADGATATVELDEDMPRAGYTVHPALLDGCLQTLTTLSEKDLQRVVSVGSAHYYGDPGPSGQCRISVRQDGEGVLADVSLLDDDGNLAVVLFDVKGVPLRFDDIAAPLTERLIERVWESTDLVAGEPVDPAGVVLVGDAGHPLADALPYRRVESAEFLAGNQFSAIVQLVDSAPGGGLPAAEDAVLVTRDLVRAAVEQTGTAPRLLLVTTGAAGQPGPASLRGLVRVLAYEHPALHATWLDIDPAEIEAADKVVAAELSAAAPVHDEVVFRDGRRQVAVLRRAAHAKPPTEPVIRADGGYVITGGLGGLGLFLAEWLADNGVGRIVLNGRSAPTPDAEAVIARLRGGGTDVRVEHGDIAEPGVAERLIAAAGEGNVAPRGVIHAAALFGDRTVTRLERDTLRQTWLPKAHGAWRLHEASKDVPLDWWLAFSSVVSLAGLPGQPAYATANAYVDALAELRRAEGLPATVINWGTWAQVGAAADLDVPWLHAIRPAEGLEVIESALGSGRSGLGALRLNGAHLASAFPELATLPFLQDLVGAYATEEQASSWPGVDALSELDGREGRALVADQLRSRVASVLGLNPPDLDAHTSLPALGVDSLLAVRIGNAVEHDFGLTLPVSLLLRGGSLAELVDWVQAELNLTDADAKAAQSGDVRVPARDAAERLIVAAAEDVLKRPVGVTDDLSALCPAPEPAESLVRTIADRARCEVRVDQLRELPTPELLAQVIRDAEAASGPVRVLREGSDEAPPLFFFHPGGGNTAVYRQLVDSLGGDFAAYGFDRVDDTRSVPERAAEYLDELRKLSPNGRYRLVGWSFGGFLAYEVAQQLAAAGEHVEVLALIDPILPLPLPDDTDEEELMRVRLERYTEFLETSYGKRITLPYAELARLDEHAQADYLVEALKTAGVVNEQVSGAIMEHQRASFVDARLLERYEPQRYAGRVVFYSADRRVPGGLRDPRFDRLDAAKGWDEFCPDLTLVSVPGHHLSLLDPPNVEFIAGHLGEHVLDALGDAPVRRAG